MEYLGNIYVLTARDMIQVYKQKPYHCAIIFYTPIAILLQLLSFKWMHDSHYSLILFSVS